MSSVIPDSSRSFSEQDALEEILRQETLRHIEAAWEAERRLARLCWLPDKPGKRARSGSDQKGEGKQDDSGQQEKEEGAEPDDAALQLIDTLPGNVELEQWKQMAKSVEEKLESADASEHAEKNVPDGFEEGPNTEKQESTGAREHAEENIASDEIREGRETEKQQSEGGTEHAEEKIASDEITEGRETEKQQSEGGTEHAEEKIASDEIREGRETEKQRSEGGTEHAEENVPDEFEEGRETGMEAALQLPIDPLPQDVELENWKRTVKSKEAIMQENKRKGEMIRRHRDALKSRERWKAVERALEAPEGEDK